MGIALAESAELSRRRLSDLEIVESAPRTVFEAKSSYVFESALEDFGDQNALQTEVKAGRRFLLSGNFYLRLSGYTCTTARCVLRETPPREK